MIKFDKDINIEEKINEVEVAMKNSKNIRMYKRYSVIRNHLLGYTNKNIAKMEIIAPHTVGIYVKNYYQSGLEGLGMKYDNCGSERKLSTKQEIELLDVISHCTPSQVGFENRYNWTIAIVKEYLENMYDVKYCLSATHVVMKRLGLTHTRPTYVLAKADKGKQEQFKENFDLLKKISTTGSSTYSISR